MMRAIILSAAWLALAVAPAAARPDDPPAKAPAELQGVWKLKSLEVNGKGVDPLGGGSPRWVIKDDKVFYGKDELARLTADPSTSPRVIDLKFRDPERVYEGIYAVEKDTLKVCINKRADGAKDRPDKFATEDKAAWLLMVFEREKAAPADATEGLTGYVGVALAYHDERKAVLITAPITNSPADKAGLKKDDVILKIGATDATDLNTTVNAIREKKAGAKLDIRISRDGKESVVTVTVGVLPFHFVAGLS
jgi:uncharacterized protein (TIGR03067 family)